MGDIARKVCEIDRLGGCPDAQSLARSCAPRWMKECMGERRCVQLTRRADLGGAGRAIRAGLGSARHRHLWLRASGSEWQALRGPSRQPEAASSASARDTKRRSSERGAGAAATALNDRVWPGLALTTGLNAARAGARSRRAHARAPTDARADGSRPPMNFGQAGRRVEAASPLDRGGGAPSLGPA